MIEMVIMIPGCILFGALIFLTIKHFEKKARKKNDRPVNLRLGGKEEEVTLSDFLFNLSYMIYSENDPKEMIEAINTVMKKFDIPRNTTIYYDMIEKKAMFHWNLADKDIDPKTNLRNALTDLISLIDHQALIIKPYDRIDLEANIEHVEEDMRLLQIGEYPLKERKMGW